MGRDWRVEDLLEGWDILLPGGCQWAKLEGGSERK